MLFCLTVLVFLPFIQSKISSAIDHKLTGQDDESGRETPPVWDYFGEDGALGERNWAEGYPTCNGSIQSPIDIIQSPLNSSLGLRFINHDAPRSNLILRNTGHTVELLLPGNQSLPCIKGAGLPGRFCLRSIHFHASLHDNNGSEHSFSGIKKVLEMHVLYAREGGNATNETAEYAIIAVTFTLNDTGSACLDTGLAEYQIIFDGLRNIPYRGQSTTLSKNIKLRLLFPFATRMTNIFGTRRVNRSFFRYTGSITVPPCTENVIWTIFEDEMCIRSNQMRDLRGLYRTAENETKRLLLPNIRGLQSITGRSIAKGEIRAKII